MVIASKMVFAIRVGEHIELRTAREPLKARVSKWTKTTTKTRPVWHPEIGDFGGYQYEDKPHKVTFKQVFFVGGKVVGYLKATKFERQFHIRVPKDKAVLLEGVNAENVLNPEWRRRNL